MKLSIENYTLRRYFGDKKALELIANAGFDSVDFSFYWMPEGERILEREDYLDFARQVRAWADEYGLEINQGHAPFDLSLADTKEKQAYDYEQILRSIKFSGILGIKQLIVHNLVTESPSDFHDVNLKFFKSLEASAHTAGIKIAVENLWNTKDGKIVGGRFSTPEELSSFLDELGPDNFCGCIDLGHSQITGVDPAEFILKLGAPQLQALHVQDTDLIHDTHTLPYLGKQNWESITAALRKTGYSGDLTFEIFAFLGALPKDALPDALKLAHTVGRKLIHAIES